MARRLARRDFLKDAVALGAGWALLPRLARAGGEPAASGGEWLSGDLHCHTVYSHDVWGGPGDDNTDPDEAYTLGWTPAEQIAIAEARSLDFLAITDHNDVRALTDAGYTSQRLVLIPGYEHSLSKGHAGCLGVRSKFAIDTPNDAGALQLRDAVHAAGGLFILNHPFYGSGWRYSPAVRPDSVEVWNIGWPYRHVAPDVPSSPSVSDNYKSLPYWEESFLAGGRMPANGGSDNHWRSTVAVQGVGQPTTWVYSSSRSWPAILDAIRAGRTTVSAEPASMGGVRTFLTATAGTNEWMVGDVVPSTAGTVQVRTRVMGAPGHTLQVVIDGTPAAPVPVTSHDFEHVIGVDAAARRRVRAEIYADEGYWMAALTSPIYFG